MTGATMARPGSSRWASCEAEWSLWLGRRAARKRHVFSMRKANSREQARFGAVTSPSRRPRDHRSGIRRDSRDRRGLHRAGAQAWPHAAQGGDLHPSRHRSRRASEGDRRGMAVAPPTTLSGPGSTRSGLELSTDARVRRASRVYFEADGGTDCQGNTSEAVDDLTEAHSIAKNREPCGTIKDIIRCKTRDLVACDLGRSYRWRHEEGHGDATGCMYLCAGNHRVLPSTIADLSDDDYRI